MSTRVSRHHQSFFDFRFFSRKSQSQQKLPKKFPHFTIQFRSKNLTHFMNLTSLDIENNMPLQHSQRPLWIYSNFSSKHFSVLCQKKHLHSTFSWRPKMHFFKHLESKCPFLSVYLRKKRRGKILPDGAWVGRRLNNFINAARFFGLRKMFLIEIFANSTIFQHFDTSIDSIKTLKFSRQFRLQG